MGSIQENLQEFYDDIDDFLETVRTQRVPGAMRRLIGYAIRKIVQRTPVDTGRARANWQLTRTTLSTRVFKKTDPDGDETIEKALAQLAFIEPYGQFYIANNLDYIEFLENGSSKQAPNGMVEITVMELRGMMFE